MTQYRRLKEGQGDAFLFFRLGDFYEMFGHDAQEASRLLGLTLTSRNGTPMCGVPYHAAKTYIHRLLRASKKVAICEQTSLPEKGKGLVDRDIVEVLTPGTVGDDYLDSTSANYLVAYAEVGGHLSLAFLDLSTGEFGATKTSVDAGNELVGRELQRLRPAEVIVPESLFEKMQGRDGGGDTALYNRYPDWYFDADLAYRTLTETFKTANLDAFGLSTAAPELIVLGVLITYAKENSRSTLSHIRDIRLYGDNDYVGLDESTQRNLELVRAMQDGGKRYTLLSVLDETSTPMGSRLLSSWILHPLRNRDEINNRLDGVEALYKEQLTLSRVRDELGSVRDLERLAGRIAMEKAHPKDISSLADSLRRIDDLSALVEEHPVLALGGKDVLTRLVAFGSHVASAIADNPPVSVADGGVIRTGFDAEVDRLRGLCADTDSYLEQYLDEERRATGIASLKIRQNRVLGHYLEVTNPNRHLVPDYFQRRQSLVNGERFTTQRLLEIEEQLNSAEESLLERERELFVAILQQASTLVGDILSVAHRIARLDVLVSFAYRATRSRYTRPELRQDAVLEIEEGRHPVVEAFAEGSNFVPNSLRFGKTDPAFALITGPNMAGKSTYLRQTALIVLMAQIGSFVPAESATIGLVDRIFCRVGASDNLARGQSTFLVEMSEAAHILRRATERSLVIMDEVGRGTGTEDGLAIATAITEHLVHHLRCRTLFATHYHELTSLEIEGLANKSLKTAEHEGRIVFLKQVIDGPSNNSYGIEVARLAGLPEAVIARAKEVLQERGGPVKGPVGTDTAGEGAPVRAAAQQAALFPAEDLIVGELRSLDLDNMTPMQALVCLQRWKSEIGDGD